MINDKNWQDSYLDRINIEFDKCLIELTDRSDRYRVIICYKFSSINYIGQYDENVIKSIIVVDHSELVQETKNTVKKNNSDCVSLDLKQLEIILIDGVSIQIVASEFVIT